MIKIKKGGTSQNDFYITDEDNLPVDLSGLTFRFTIKEDKDSDSPIYQTSLNALPNPSEGIVTVSILAEETALFEAGSYVADIMLSNDAGEKFYSSSFRVRVEPTVSA